MEPNEIRGIVPGRYDKLKSATLRPVTVPRLHREGPLALADLAGKKAEKTFKGFRTAYSTLYIMLSLPEEPPDPIFEQIWQALTLPDEGKVILTVVTVDSEGGQLDIETKNIPAGWRWEWMEVGLRRERTDADEDDIFDIDPIGFDQGTPYNHTNHL